MEIALSRSDREALLRLAKACGHRRAVNWLESVRRDDDGWYAVYMGDMRVYLTEIVLDFDVARTVRSGSAFTHDLDVLCGLLSHCHQVHIDADDVLDGNVGRIVDETAKLER